MAPACRIAKIGGASVGRYLIGAVFQHQHGSGMMVWQWLNIALQQVGHFHLHVEVEAGLNHRLLGLLLHQTSGQQWRVLRDAGLECQHRLHQGQFGFPSGNDAVI